MCFNDEYIRMTRLLIIMPDIMILNCALWIFILRPTDDNAAILLS